MMRTGFPGYGSALQAKVRSPARNAGATRSLAAERRFKRTDGASGRDLQSSIRTTPVLRYDDGRRQPSRRASRRLDQCGGLLHDRLGRGVSLCQKRVDLGRRQRLDLQLRLVRIGAKFTIGYRGVESAPAAATMTSRARAAAMVLISDRCQVAQTFCNLPMLPSQLNFCAS